MATKTTPKGRTQSAKGARVNVGTLTVPQRKALAKKIADLRKAGTPWDGDNGICAQLGLAGAPVGRKLLREIGWDTGKGIRPSYDRAAKKAAAKPATTRKRAAKKS